MTKTLSASFALALLLAGAAQSSAQDAYAVSQDAFTEQQMDNLVAPIALYPDPILAQVLVAATFPDQIEFAARYVRANGTRGIDDQPWDVSVRSVAHYSPVLNMLAERPDWTVALGRAYALQSSEVMDAVQRLRRMAREQGNLRSTDEQDVVVERDRILIVPARPQVIYVPTYDPWYVYYRPVVWVGGRSAHWSFGIGFPIGSWLIYDCDWWGRSVYYHGWYGGGWRAYSRPYVHITNVYVSPRYEVVHVNRRVADRRINYGNLGRYNSVHRTVGFGGRGNGPANGPGRGNGRGSSGGYDDGWNDRGDDRRDDRRPGEIEGRGNPGGPGSPGNGRGGNPPGQRGDRQAPGVIWGGTWTQGATRTLERRDATGDPVRTTVPTAVIPGSGQVAPRQRTEQSGPVRERSVDVQRTEIPRGVVIPSSPVRTSPARTAPPARVLPPTSEPPVRSAPVRSPPVQRSAPTRAAPPVREAPPTRSAPPPRSSGKASPPSSSRSGPPAKATGKSKGGGGN